MFCGLNGHQICTATNICLSFYWSNKIDIVEVIRNEKNLHFFTYTGSDSQTVCEARVEKETSNSMNFPLHGKLKHVPIEFCSVL